MAEARGFRDAPVDRDRAERRAGKLNEIGAMAERLRGRRTRTLDADALQHGVLENSAPAVTLSAAMGQVDVVLHHGPAVLGLLPLSDLLSRCDEPWRGLVGHLMCPFHRK